MPESVFFAHSHCHPGPKQILLQARNRLPNCSSQVGSHLGQETNIGQHGSLPVYNILFYLAVGFDARYFAPLVKVHMASLYFVPGLLKLVCAGMQGQRWWAAPSMQQYMFAALWARPGGRMAGGVGKRYRHFRCVRVPTVVFLGAKKVVSAFQKGPVLCFMGRIGYQSCVSGSQRADVHKA